MTDETATKTIIANIKVWSDTMKKEYRVYVRTTDKREGCYYITGNRYHPAKSIDGQLTEEEWQEVRRLSVYDGKWHTVYESELHGTIWGKPLQTSNRRERCPDCGGYTCGGGNCASNRW